MIPRGNPLLKRADRYGGIPLVLALRRWRRRDVPRRLDTIGLLKTNAIGDTVLLSGVVQDLRAALPDAHLALLVGPNNEAIARLIPGADGVVRLPIHRLDRAAALLRAQRLDALLDFGSWPRINAVLARLSGARFTAGFRTAAQHRHHVYDRRVDHSPAIHEIENYRRLVGLLGVHGAALPRLDPGAAPDLPGLEAPYAVLHAWPGGTRRELKQWPRHRWAELAAHLEDRGLQRVFTGGPGDEEQARELAVECGGRCVAGKLSIAQLAGLLGGARLVVSVDTGVMHMASALNTPLVALHGPTLPARWGPLGPRTAPVATTTAGCGYLNLGFDYPDSPPQCMEGVSVPAVLDAVDGLLGA